MVRKRYGVLNKVPEKAMYVTKIEEVILNKEIIRLIKSQIENIERIVIYTNQPWVSKETINQKINEQIKYYFLSIFSGINIEVFYLFCPHSFEERCECRKPKIGNIIKLSQVKPFLRRKINL